MKLSKLQLELLEKMSYEFVEIKGRQRLTAESLVNKGLLEREDRQSVINDKYHYYYAITGKGVEYLRNTRWVKIDRLPKVGQKVECKVNFWRHGSISHQEIVVAKLLGINEVTNSPMFDINKYEDEAFAEVTEWRPLNASKK